MTAKTINVRLPEALYNQIEELAKATARTKSFLTIDALTSYVQRESWQIRDIHEGIQEADAGEFAPTTRSRLCSPNTAPDRWR
jgi:RHH-type rel operon transcriptional repressor/antitoxin RelB